MPGIVKKSAELMWNVCTEGDRYGTLEEVLSNCVKKVVCGRGLRRRGRGGGASRMYMYCHSKSYVRVC